MIFVINGRIRSVKVGLKPARRYQKNQVEKWFCPCCRKSAKFAKPELDIVQYGYLGYDRKITMLLCLACETYYYAKYEDENGG